MPLGTVKWWNDDFGYGFIIAADGSDVFVHHSAVEADGYVVLTEGQQVEFAALPGPRGPMAAHVRPPGQPARQASTDRSGLPRHGVRSFTGSLRRIEYEINEWVNAEDVDISSLSLTRLQNDALGALVIYVRDARDHRDRS